MNLHALRLFYRVAEKGNVTRAAEELNLSQPAVTAQIKKLEQEIGLVLFAPKGRGVLLTEAGLLLMNQARRLFSLEQEISDTINQYKQGSVGKLRIVATYLPANFLLPNWMGRYKKNHPDVEVELTTTNSLKAIEKLIHYEAEIAFIGGINKFHPLISPTELFEDDMVFVVHKDHRYASKTIPLSEIVKEPFVIREEGSFSRDQLVSLCKVNSIQEPDVGLQINGLHETIRTVIEGYGITFVSSLEVQEYIERGELAKIHIDGVALKNPISLCTRKNDSLSQSAHHLFELVLDPK